MPFSGTTLINNLARRVRDTTNLAHTRAFLVDILNRCARVLNAATRSKLATASFTPTANQVLFQASAVVALASQIKIIGIRDAGGRDLMEVPWEHLVFSDPQWLRRTGNRHEIFATIGRDLLAIYPAQTTPGALIVTYVKQPTALLDNATNWELPDELVPMLLDLAEIIVYLRGRVFTPASAIAEPLERLSKAFGIEIPYATKRHAEEDER